MSTREPTATTDLDTTSGTGAIPWSRPLELLDGGAFRDGAAAFLGTVRPDGRPHAARIGAAWYDGHVYFQTGSRTRKARNLEVNPACTLSTSLPGIDLVFEGVAERVTDGPTLEAVAAAWREGGLGRRGQRRRDRRAVQRPRHRAAAVERLPRRRTHRARRRDRRAVRRHALAVLTDRGG